MSIEGSTGGLPFGVPYPSRKPPVNPVKDATKKAVQRLRENNVELAQLGRGYPTIYGLAKYSPVLLERVLEAVERGNDRERTVWGEALSYLFFSVADAESIEFHIPLYFQLVPLAAKTMRVNKPVSARLELRKVTAHINTVHRLRPSVPIDVNRVYSAAELYFDIKVDNIRTSRTHNDRRVIHELNVDDILFIADHLEEVQGVVPELNRRKARDREVIAALLEAGTKPLMDGVL